MATNFRLAVVMRRLRFKRHGASAVGHLDAGEAGLAGPVEAFLGAALGPGHLEEGAAEAGPDPGALEGRHLVLYCRIQVGGSEAQLPHVDVFPHGRQPRLEFAYGQALVDDVGEADLARLLAAAGQAEKGGHARSHSSIEGRVRSDARQATASRLVSVAAVCSSITNRAARVATSAT